MLSWRIRSETASIPTLTSVPPTSATLGTRRLPEIRATGLSTPGQAHIEFHSGPETPIRRSLADNVGHASLWPGNFCDSSFFLYLPRGRKPEFLQSHIEMPAVFRVFEHRDCAIPGFRLRLKTEKTGLSLAGEG